MMLLLGPAWAGGVSLSDFSFTASCTPGSGNIWAGGNANSTGGDYEDADLGLDLIGKKLQAIVFYGGTGTAKTMASLSQGRDQGWIV